MVKNVEFQRAPLVLAIAAVSTFAPGVLAQQVEMDSVAAPQMQQFEEVMVQGRLKDSAEALVMERLDDEVVTDVLGAEMIGRIGDSTVAAALRRVSGLSLVNDKFVYVRGLGERYSSTTLNGAVVPSPDLTRNVIPLDIFPTSVVDSLSVQKTYSADQAATFGGGSVDIRTKGIPEELTFSVEVGAGVNSESSGDAMTYRGGSDDSFGTDDGTRGMSAGMEQSLRRFKGDLGLLNIRNTLIAEGQTFSSVQEANAAAQAVNREIALNLNREVAIEEKSTSPDSDFKASVGNRFYLNDELEVGFLAGGAYKTKWRSNESVTRNFVSPDEILDSVNQSTYSVDISGNLNFGVRYGNEHNLETTSLYLRNTDDRTEVVDIHTTEREYTSGRGFRQYALRFEERDMVVNQVKGNHIVGPETKALIPGNLLNWVPDDVSVDWFYSDSTAATDIPNEVLVNADIVTDGNGSVTSETLLPGSSSANFRFTELEDEVINYGWEAKLPLEFSSSSLELSGGFARTEKGRSYKETKLWLGTSTALDSSDLDDVFSDESITDAGNDFLLTRTGDNSLSYLAATLTDAAFGKIDWTIAETWRIAAGARWEDYNQVALEWNPYGFTIDNPQVSMDPDVLAQSTYSEDNIYPSLSLTYMGSLWAETFQLRLGASKTSVRPDLREITDAIYIDPVTRARVKGNSDVRPSEIQNYDVRAEWFFDDGDNLTVSAYYKDILNPIEFFQLAASSDVAREIVNADSGEILGVELEGLKSLGFLGDTMDNFFVQGNLTLQQTELVAGTKADAPTNPIRDMTGASEYVVNMMAGFDSPDGNHSATISYNVFGDRLYSAGRNGEPDAYEQPFHSLDLTYSWYPTAEVIIKAKLQNLLGESIEIERENVVVFEETPGQSFSLSAQYQF